MEELPKFPAPEVAPSSATLEEIKANIDVFLKNGDIDGLAGFIDRAAFYDHLTEIRNRRGFFREAERLLREVLSDAEHIERRQGHAREEFAIIFLDVDFFKKLNDTHGHAAGDAALRFVGQILTSVVREEDTVGRLGGEEFAVALKVTEAGLRFKVAEKICKAIEKSPFLYEGKIIPLTVSVGVAKLKKDENIDELIGRADEAMYAAKRAGRNQVMVAEEMVPSGK